MNVPPRQSVEVLKRGKVAVVRLPEHVLEEWGWPPYVALTFTGGALLLTPLRAEGVVMSVLRGEGAVYVSAPREVTPLAGADRRFCLHAAGERGFVLHPGEACPGGHAIRALWAGWKGGYVFSIPREVYERMGEPRFLVFAPCPEGVLVEPLAGGFHRVQRVLEDGFITIPRFLMEAWCWPRRLRLSRRGEALQLEPPPLTKRLECALCGEELADADEALLHLASRHGVEPPGGDAVRALYRAGLLRRPSRVTEERFRDALARVLSRQRGSCAIIPAARICRELGLTAGAACSRRVRRLAQRLVEGGGGLRIGEWALARVEAGRRPLRLVFVRESAHSGLRKCTSSISTENTSDTVFASSLSSPSLSGDSGRT